MRNCINNLISDIYLHRYNYYIVGKAIMSDDEYDSLMCRLVELEERYPNYISVDSPTQVKGYPWIHTPPKDTPWSKLEYGVYNNRKSYIRYDYSSGYTFTILEEK